MSKFRVWGAVVGTKYLGEFEASSEEELLKLLEDGDADFIEPSLCHQCSSEVEDPVIEKFEIEEIL